MWGKQDRMSEDILWQYCTQTRICMIHCLQTSKCSMHNVEDIRFSHRDERKIFETCGVGWKSGNNAEQICNTCRTAIDKATVLKLSIHKKLEFNIEANQILDENIFASGEGQSQLVHSRMRMQNIKHFQPYLEDSTGLTTMTDICLYTTITFVNMNWDLLTREYQICSSSSRSYK